MKEFFCGAVVPHCGARFEGETEQAIVSQVLRHAHDDHGMEHVPDDVLEAVRGHIRDVA
jgi:predicted small metal-binding protein